MLTIESYTIAVVLFSKLLGFVFFFAFGAFLFQIRGLVGKKGILPVSEFLQSVAIQYPRHKYLYFPTLFWINSSNSALMGLIVGGTLISLLLMVGIFPALCLFLLYVLYLSIVSAGQDFLSFGWEGFLLEITAHAFLLNLTTAPNLMVWMSINVLLFRFHFQAGAVKLQSRDPSWKNLTAIAYHYQTQPLPNTQAWYVYKLPLWFHKFSTLAMFVTELIVPFGIFGTEEIRLGVFVAFLGLQLMIWGTGNFSFLNHLTIALTTILLNNRLLSLFFTPPSVSFSSSFISTLTEWALSILGALLLSLQCIRLWNHFRPHLTFDRWLRKLSPFHLANRYGIFAVMTTKRYEIIIEGSMDGDGWEEYTFQFKPSEITRRPKRISPYQPRIDWQIWFLPFTNFHNEWWFQQFLYHLLKGTPDVLKLLRGNPFPNKPPKYIRALMYDYEFSSFNEKQKYGWWWRRRYVASYSPTLCLKEDEEK